MKEMLLLMSVVSYFTALPYLRENFEVESALNLRKSLEVEEEVVYTNEVDHDYDTLRQTFYSKQEGETTLGYASKTIHDTDIKVINNVYHYLDKEYGWLPIIAWDIDVVIDSGMTDRGTYNKFGSVYELVYPNGTTTNAIVLDSCGACSRDPKVDLWVEYNDYKLDVKEVQVRLIRYGF